MTVHGSILAHLHFSTFPHYMYYFFSAPAVESAITWHVTAPPDLKILKDYTKSSVLLHNCPFFLPHTHKVKAQAVQSAREQPDIWLKSPLQATHKAPFHHCLIRCAFTQRLSVMSCAVIIATDIITSMFKKFDCFNSMLEPRPCVKYRKQPDRWIE